MEDLSLITFDDNSNPVFEKSTKGSYEKYVWSKYTDEHRVSKGVFTLPLNIIGWIGGSVLIASLVMAYPSISPSVLLGVFVLIYLSYWGCYLIINSIHDKLNNDVDYAKTWRKLRWFYTELEDISNQYSFIHVYYKNYLVDFREKLSSIHSECLETVEKYKSRISDIKLLGTGDISVKLKSGLLTKCKEASAASTANAELLSAILKTIYDAIEELVDPDSDICRAGAKKLKIAEIKNWISNLDRDIADQTNVEANAGIISDVLLPHQTFINNPNIQQVIDRITRENDEAMAYLEAKII